MNIAPVSASAGALPAAAQERQLTAPVPEAEIRKKDAAPGEADPAALQQRVDELNAAMKQHASTIVFSVDDESGRTIVKVVDTDTDTVLRQYPSTELLAISRQIDKFQGMFVKTQA